MEPTVFFRGLELSFPPQPSNSEEGERTLRLELIPMANDLPIVLIPLKPKRTGLGERPGW